jgi:hypothetical protein
MRREKMFKKCIITTAILGLAALSFAQKVKYSDSWGSQGFSIAKSAVSGVSITHSINEFELSKAQVNGETLTTVQLPGVFLPNDEGAPDLPGSARYIAVPQGAKASFKITDFRKETYQNIDVSPASNIPIDIDRMPLTYKRNMEIYSKDAFFPDSPVILSEPAQIRGMDVVLLGITPFQYNPVKKELVVYRDIKVEVIFEGGNGRFGDDRLRNAEWDRILKNTIFNSSVIGEAVKIKINDTKATGYEYIIICPNDATYLSYANQLKTFRVKQGIKTTVVTTTEIGGNTSAAIEAYINNAYNNWDIPPSAVLLMADYGASGSAGTIFCPTFSDTYYPCVSDNFYADVITTDGKALPEIVFARMTAQNEAHLQAMVSKIINYETNPPTDVNFYKYPITALGWQTERLFQICSVAIGGFLRNGLGKTPVRINALYEGNPSSDPWSTAINTSQVTSYFGPSGRGYITATPQETGGFTGGVAANITTAINNGAFMLVHRDHGIYYGWGEPAYQTTNISSLTNINNKLPFIFSMNCQTGMYDNAVEVFSERFHRYTYSGSNSGALGVLAATHNSYSFVNDAFGWGIMDYIWPNYMPDYGAAPTNNDEFMPAFAMVSGKYFLDYSSWPYNTTEKEETNYLFHIFGDPYMVVYSEVPQLLTINKQDIYENDTVFYVTADAGAKITLVANGEIIGKGIGTGSTSSISIIPQSYGTQITLTVTKQNYFRHESIITVAEITNTGGTYAINLTSHDFGIVNAGDSSTKQFTITNSHGSEFIVGNIIRINGYIVNQISKASGDTVRYVVPPLSSKTFDLIFAPAGSGVFNGNIIITSTASGHETEYISVSGTGAAPDLNAPVQISATTAPETSVNKYFDIENTGLQTLSYSIEKSYSGYAIPAGNYHSNNFQSGLVYTNSGGISWATATGGTWNENTTCASTAAAQGTAVMTSPVFETTSAGSVIYLDFDQASTHVSGTSRKVEWFNGSSWVQAYYNNTAAYTGHTRIELAGVSQLSQLRFTAVNVKSGPTTSSWKVDNIVVSYENVQYNWLSIVSPLTGTVAPSGSNEINISYSASGLTEGIYEASLTILSNDPVEPSYAIPVIFTVSNSTFIPGVPSNVATSISGSNLVIDWNIASDATSYDIYSSDDPYGSFTFEANSATNQYTIPYTASKKFYYIISRNATK